MTDTEKLNTTCKRLQLQCFRNYVMCNAVDEKLHEKLHESQLELTDLDDKFTKQINALSQELSTKIAKQQRGLTNVYTEITMISIIRLLFIALIAWWLLQK